MNDRILPTTLKACLLTGLLWLCASGIFAQTINSGATHPDSCISNAAVGTLAWSSPLDVISSNNSYASCGALLGTLASAQTNYLQASGYGFSIPASATISGIEVRVERNAVGLLIGASVTDKNVYLMKAGTQIGTNHASGAGWSGSDVVAIYGNSADLWGTSWTPAQINATNFGTLFSAQLSAGLSSLYLTANVDAISVTVYYQNSLTPPSVTGQPSSQTICVNANTTLGITATGATSYQWQTDSATGIFQDLSNNAIYSNVTKDTLTISNIPASYNGYKYRCKVTGSTTVISDSAQLMLNTAPVFSMQPSDTTGCPGSAFTFSSSASAPADTIIYRWQVDNGSGFVNIADTNSLYANAGTTTLKINSAQPAFYNYNYRLSATNSCGVAYSNNAGLKFPSSTGTRDFTGSGNWNDPANWTPCGIPLTTETVTIGSGDSVVIPAGYHAVSKGIWIARGQLIVQPASTLIINDAAGAGIAASPGSRLFNYGNLTINNAAYDGIYLDSAFLNNTGKTEINNIISNGIWAENTSTVVNSGELSIGTRGTIGHRGIFCTNGSTFTNTTTGLIHSDSVVTHNGVEMQTGAVLTNNGTIYTGTLGSLSEDGLYMYRATFINNGVMNVANARRAGIQLIESTLTNKGQLSTTNTTAVGVFFDATSTAVNDTSGTISVDRVVNGEGIVNRTSLTNRGLIRIGTAGPIARTGIYNETGSGFMNTVTGRVVINDIPNVGYYGIFSRGSIYNQGTIKIGNIKPIYAIGIILNSPATLINDSTGLIEVNNILERDALQLAAGTSAINYGTFRSGNLGPVNRNAVFVAPASGTASFVNAASGIMELDNVPNPAGSYGAVTIRAIASFTNNGMLKIGLNTACRAGFCGSAGVSNFINNGSIVMGKITGEAIASSAIVNNNNGGNIRTNGSGKMTIAGQLLNNTGAFIINNATDTMTVDSVLNNSGTIVNNGLLKGRGTIIQNGIFTNGKGSHIAPGSSPGTLTVAGDFNLGYATLDIEVNGPAASTQYDVLRVTGTANVTNTSLNTTFGGGYVPGNNDVITFLDADSITGTMGSILPGGVNIRYNYPSAGRASLGNSTALPVKLLFFGAHKVNEGRNLISFASADEGKGVTYEVTRSHNGVDFKTISTLIGKGNGSSYTIYDEDPLRSTNFYRLTITETTGQVTYSNIAVVQNGGDKNGVIIIAPVPASVTVTISSTDAAVNGTEAMITDLYGKVVHRFLMSASSQVNVSSWPVGTYLLHLSNGNTMKLIKQ